VSAGRGRRRSAATEERPASLRLWPPPEGFGLAGATAFLLFSAHLAYGALLAEPALIATAAAALLLLGALATPRLRKDLLRVRGLLAPAVLFLLVLAVGVLSMTPFAPGGAHPVWSYVGLSPGAATIDRSATLLELVKLMGLGCLFLVGAATGASDERAKTAVNLLILLAAALGLWAFFGFVTGGLYQSQKGRLEASFFNPNTAGTFFAAMVIVTLGPLMRRLRGVRLSRAVQVATAHWAALLILVACLLMTASRGAALATGAALGGLILLMLFSGKIAWSRATFGVLAGLLAAAVLLFLFGERLVARFEGVEESAVSRGELFALHWQAFLASPWMGYGLGTFDIVHRTLLDASSTESLWRIRATHNVYIQWLEEAGLIGALPMFGAITAVLAITAVRGLGRSRMTHILFALMASNIVFLVHGFSDFALQTPSMALFWSYLLGLQFALSQGTRR
jgi:O-antigen ligase